MLQSVRQAALAHPGVVLLAQRGDRRGDAAVIGTVGVNALLGKRATSTLFQASGSEIADEDYIAEWTAMLAGRIESLR